MGEAVVVKPLQTLQVLLDKAKPTIAKLLGSDLLTAERLAKVAFNCVSRTPRLQQCSGVSIVRAVIQSAELGLEPGSALGDAYLVPYRNSKTGMYEAQFQPGYRGLARLAIEEGLAKKIDTMCVFENDEFGWDDRVLPPKPKHKPCGLLQERGKLIGAYCVMTLPDGSQKWEVMTLAEIHHVRNKSKSKDDGPWKTDENEMARKTVWKRASKMLGIRPGSKMAKATDIDDAVEAGDIEAIDLPEVVEVAPAELPPAKPSSLSDLTARMKSGMAETLSKAGEASKRAKATLDEVEQEPPPGTLGSDREPGQDE